MPPLFLRYFHILYLWKDCFLIFYWDTEIKESHVNEYKDDWVLKSFDFALHKEQP